MGYVKYAVQMVSGKRYHLWAMSESHATKMAVCRAESEGRSGDVKWIKKYDDVYKKRVINLWDAET